MDLAITSLGMISSVGFGVVASCAALRAGVVRPRELDGFRVLEGEPPEESALTGHPVEGYTEGFGGLGRWLRLARGSVVDLRRHGRLPGLEELPFWERTGLIVVVPTPAPDQLTGAVEQARAALKRAYVSPLLTATRLPIDPRHTDVVWTGKAGIAEAACLAQRLIESGRTDRAIVLAADSLLEDATLEALLRDRRLRTPDLSAGLSPGEAAACFLLESRWSQRKREAPLEARLRSAVFVADPDFARTGPHTARAMSRAIDGALQAVALPVPFPGDVHTDFNGESWRAMHLSLARVRLSARISPRAELLTACESLGDVGVASGAVAVCAAARAHQRQYARSGESLVLAQSDRGACGALVLTRAEE